MRSTTSARRAVRVSLISPSTFDITGSGGQCGVLEAIREAGVTPRFYQASSSEMFGAAPPPQYEETPFHPRSPYGVAKVAACWATVNYREAYDMFAVNGILFNHESPRRGETFVTRKITRAVAQIAAGLQDKLFLGNLDAKRDWGYAGLRRGDVADAPGRGTRGLRDRDGRDPRGPGGGRDRLRAGGSRLGAICRDRPEVLRPSEVDVLLGDASKAKEKLGWEPKVRFRELVELMVDADVAALEDQLAQGDPLQPRGRLSLDLTARAVKAAIVYDCLFPNTLGGPSAGTGTSPNGSTARTRSPSSPGGGERKVPDAVRDDRGLAGRRPLHILGPEEDLAADPFRDGRVLASAAPWAELRRRTQRLIPRFSLLGAALALR